MDNERPKDPTPEQRLEALRAVERIRGPWEEPPVSDRPTDPGPPPVLSEASHQPSEPWPTFSLGELVDVNGFVYRVGHVGPAHLLLEPAAPFLVAGSEAAPFAATAYHRLVELWNGLSYASTTLSRLIGQQDNQDTAREVLRVVRLVQEGGPGGHQVSPQPDECLPLEQLARQAQLRLAERLQAGGKSK